MSDRQVSVGSRMDARVEIYLGLIVNLRKSVASIQDAEQGAERGWRFQLEVAFALRISSIAEPRIGLGVGEFPSKAGRRDLTSQSPSFFVFLIQEQRRLRTSLASR